MAKALIVIKSDSVASAAKRMGRLRENMKDVSVTAAGRFRRGLDSMKSRVVSLRTGLAAAGVYGFGRFVASTLQASNAMRSAENGFARLISTRGVGGARDLLKNYNTQLDGMIDRATVAATASRLMATNSNLNTKAVGKLLRFSRDWADTTGQELLPVVQTLSTALGGLEPESIRRLGLEVDWKTALDAKAKALHKSAAALTEEEKRAAKTAEVLDAIAKKHREIGRTALTAANNLNRMSANWQNIKAGIGEGFGEIFGPSLQMTADLMQGKGEGVVTRAGMDAGEGGLVDAMGDYLPDWVGETGNPDVQQSEELTRRMREKGVRLDYRRGQEQQKLAVKKMEVRNRGGH